MQDRLATGRDRRHAGRLLLAVAVGWLRYGADRVYPWLPVCAAMLAAYLLFNKVHSPQFVLWLLPFFVLLRIRAGWILAYFVADAAIGIGFFRWQYLINSRLPEQHLGRVRPQAGADRRLGAGGPAGRAVRGVLPGGRWWSCPAAPPPHCGR